MANSEQSTAVARLKALRGTVVPLVTPVDAQRRVCAPSMARLMASLRGKVTGYLPALSTGEGWLLDDRQWQDVVRLTVEHADGAPVLGGAEVGDIATILARAALAHELGADAIVVPPPFPVPDGERPTFVEHIRAVRAASPLPVFVYHENAVSKMPLEVAALREVCALDGVVGVKESSGDAAFTRAVLDGGLPVPLFQGWEHLICAAPGQGFVGPLANLEPEACNAALATPSRDAQGHVDELTSLYRLHAEDWYLHVKAELARRGVISTALAVK